VEVREAEIYFLLIKLQDVVKTTPYQLGTQSEPTVDVQTSVGYTDHRTFMVQETEAM